MAKGTKAIRFKAHVWVGPAIAEQLERESRRIDRSISWMMRQAWPIARATIMGLAPRSGEAGPARPVAQLDAADEGSCRAS